MNLLLTAILTGSMILFGFGGQIDETSRSDTGDWFLHVGDTGYRYVVAGSIEVQVIARERQRFAGHAAIVVEDEDPARGALEVDARTDGFDDAGGLAHFQDQAHTQLYTRIAKAGDGQDEGIVLAVFVQGDDLVLGDPLVAVLGEHYQVPDRRAVCLPPPAQASPECEAIAAPPAGRGRHRSSARKETSCCRR